MTDGPHTSSSTSSPGRSWAQRRVVVLDHRDDRVAARRRVVGQEHTGCPDGGSWTAPSTIPSLASSPPRRSSAVR